MEPAIPPQTKQDLLLGYERKEREDHGKQNNIEHGGEDISQTLEKRDVCIVGYKVTIWVS